VHDGRLRDVIRGVVVAKGLVELALESFQYFGRSAAETAVTVSAATAAMKIRRMQL